MIVNAFFLNLEIILIIMYFIFWHTIHIFFIFLFYQNRLRNDFFVIPLFVLLSNFSGDKTITTNFQGEKTNFYWCCAVTQFYTHR